MGPVAVAEPPGGEPLLTRMCSPPELRGRLGHHRVDLRLAGDVGRQRNDAPPGLGRQLPRRRLELVLRARDDGDVHAFAGQLARDGLADAEAASGHDRVLAAKPQVHRVTSWPAASAGLTCAGEILSQVTIASGVGPTSRLADRAGRPPVHGAKRGVEAPDAGEAGGERDRGHRHRRLVDQRLRALHAPGRARRPSARRPRAAGTVGAGGAASCRASSARSSTLCAVVEESPLDETQRARDGRRRAAPRRRPGRRLRSTAQAGPEPRALGGGRGREEDDVARLGRLHRTGGPAIDPRGQHAGEEPPVEARVARDSRAVAGTPVEREVPAPCRRQPSTRRRYRDRRRTITSENGETASGAVASVVSGMRARYFYGWNVVARHLRHGAVQLRPGLLRTHRVRRAVSSGCTAGRPRPCRRRSPCTTSPARS